MKISKYAQSTVLIEDGESRLLIDPGNYNFEPGRVTRQFFSRVDVLIVTHVHADHFDLDAVRVIYNLAKCRIITVREIAEKLLAVGIPSEIIAVGESIATSGFQIEAVYADHVVRGERVDVFGVVVSASGVRVYHTSDTMYFENKPTNIDLAFVPINNRGVAMNFEDAAKFVRELAPRIAVPVHYDSPKDSHINPSDWKVLLNDSKEIAVKIMEFGDFFEL